ncbi:histidine phosphatase superfamily-domain-containing protein [Entophlyctis helioformis]|nr:histidine phosphatase superfamily-domain-containing protein [Entophlyctis helioformis]
MAESATTASPATSTPTGSEPVTPLYAAPHLQTANVRSGKAAGKWIIGICALDNKARSKPMRNILNRILALGDFEAVVFGDKVILDEDIDHWPQCDFLISFFSNGFPLDKAIAYAQRYKPFCLNDLPMQELLLDRRLVLTVLDAVGVPTPNRLMTFRNDVQHMRPEVVERAKEMGVDLDAMYRLNTSVHLIDSETIELQNGASVDTLTKPFVEKPVSGEDHNIYIYYDRQSGGGVRKLFRKVGNKSSEFFQDISDIRSGESFIYEEFMSVDNAEDVKVYTIGDQYAHAETRKSPVIDGIVRRNAEGKEIRYITPLTDEEKEIARRVCRAFGQTVCGFDLLRANGKSYVIDVNGWSFVKGNAEYYDKCARIVRDIFLAEVARRGPEVFRRQMSVENQWRLKAYLSVLRHGDRTPKQKVKFTFKSKLFLDLLNGAVEEVAFKKPDELLALVGVVRSAIEQGVEDPAHLEQLVNILDVKAAHPGTKVQLKPGFSKVDGSLAKVQLIVKWGGVFTHGGLYQSKDLAENLRKDLNIINKELLENVVVYSSSEKRVTATADIFCKMFLDVQAIEDDFIKVDKEMLDDSNAAKEQMDSVKVRLQGILNPENPATVPPEFVLPRPDMTDLAPLVHDIVELLRLMREILHENVATKDLEKLQTRWCCADTSLLFERWEKLFRDFVDVERSQFEPSKISELYDSLKYDLLHNREFLHGIFSSPQHGNDIIPRLYTLSKELFHIIGPHEYGIENAEKLEIAFKNAYHLLSHLYNDLLTARDSPKPSTVLYFTKESKVICLLNIVLLCGLKTKAVPAEILELDYLTQISFELYERSGGLGSLLSSSLVTASPIAAAAAAGAASIHDGRASTARSSTSSASGIDSLAERGNQREYSLRIAFSPGAHDPNLIDLHLDRKHSLSVAPRKWISDHINLDDALKALNPAQRVKLNSTS